MFRLNRASISTPRRAFASGEPMNIVICQLPDNLAPDSLSWDRFARRVERAQPDITLLNEMPFGPWAARGPCGGAPPRGPSGPCSLS